MISELELESLDSERFVGEGLGEFTIETKDDNKDDKLEIVIACLYCTHFHEDSDIPQCDAFPKKIPDKIWSGKNDHTKSVTGDNNILFKLKEK